MVFQMHPEMLAVERTNQTMHGFPYRDQILVPIQDRVVPVCISGCGHPLLLLHGYPLDNRMWDPLIPLISDSFLCIAPDMRGFGKTREETRSFEIVDLAVDCDRMLDALQIRGPIAVCGLSMGGYVAMEFIERYSDRISHAILSNTRGNSDDMAGAAMRRVAGKIALEKSVREAVGPMLEKLLSSKTRLEKPNLIELVQSMMFDTKASTIVWAQLAMSKRLDFLPRMERWDLPVMCVGGELDTIVPVAVIERMCQAIPNAQLQMILRSAHLSPVEQPEAFAKIIRSFVLQKPENPVHP